MSINSKNNNKLTTTKLAVTAMLSAVAIVLQFLELSVPFVPSFLKLDFSAVPELLGAFAVGPAYGVLICFIKNLVHLTVTNSMAVGELSNFLLGAIFAFTAGMIYKYRKTRVGAIAGSLCGAFAMTAISIATNYFIVYPFYAQLWAGGDINIIINMYQVIIPSCDTLIKCLLTINVPFTFVKGFIVAIITFIIYKPLSGVIYKLNTAINNKTVDKKR